MTTPAIFTSVKGAFRLDLEDLPGLQAYLVGRGFAQAG